MQDTPMLDGWNALKKELNAREEAVIPYFEEREIWLSHVGMNIGYEEFGKGNRFLRPVLVIKKFNRNLFFGIPLSSKNKNVPFYIPIGTLRAIPTSAILIQGRTFSSKRLSQKIGVLNSSLFGELKKAASTYVFGS